MTRNVTHISSTKNPRIRQVLRLQSRRGRKQHRQTVVYGLREIRRAASARVPIDSLFVRTSAMKTLDQEWLAAMAAHGAELYTVESAVFDRIRFGDRDDGVLAVIPLLQRSLRDIRLPPNPCVAIIEQVEKPGNVGAILRSADGAGVAAVVIVDGATDLMNPNVIRASMGTVFTVPNCIAGYDELLPWVRHHGLQVITTRVDANDLYYQADFTGPTAVVLGSEARGLGQHWQDFDEHPVRLPMFGVADSLNVSATAAVLFYEVFRQRQVQS